MTPQQIKAVQESFGKLAAAWGAACGLLSDFIIGEAYGRSAGAE